MSGVRVALAAALAFVLSSSALGAAAQGLLDFSDDERRRIAAHGPWPPPPARDAGNALAGRAEAVALGARLFADPRLAIDGRFACSSCHDPQRGFADGRPRVLGRQPGERNTLGLWNAGQQRWFGWDGAADSLWHQSLRALFNANEQAATPAHLQQLVRRDAGYRMALQRLFGPRAQHADAETTAVRLAKALGAYLATLSSPRTAFDDFRDALLNGDAAAAAHFPLAAQRGLRLFVGRAGCAICHIGPLFSNGEFADIGLPFFSRPGVVDPGRHGGIRELREGPQARFNLLGRHSDERSGAAAVKTRHVEVQHRNFGEFKVPSLREAVHTAPYMHDGSLATLADVVRHYDRIDLERLHADGERILKPLHLSAGEAADLVAFVETLSRPAHRVRFEIDLREAIAAGRFDPARDRLGLRGSTPPLAWSRSIALHEPGDSASADGIVRGSVDFPRSPRGGQPLAWKAKIDRGGDLDNEGWEQGRNHALVLDRGELAVTRAFDAPAAPSPIRRSGQIVRDAAFASRHVGEREVQVWLPPGYDAASAQERRYPVLYLHDGQNVFDAAAAGAEWGADEAATALVASGELPPLIIVAVASGSNRIAEHTPWPGLIQGRSVGGAAATYARFLVEELKPFIDERYRTKTDAANTAVGGASLGGLVSIWLLLQHAETFGAGLVVSPALWWADRAILAEVAARATADAARPRIWLDIGALEGEAAVADARALRDALRTHGWSGASLAYVEDAEGSHDEASWAERFPRMLRFLYGSAGAR